MARPDRRGSHTSNNRPRRVVATPFAFRSSAGPATTKPAHVHSSSSARHVVGVAVVAVAAVAVAEAAAAVGVAVAVAAAAAVTVAAAAEVAAVEVRVKHRASPTKPSRKCFTPTFGTKPSIG